MRYDCVVFVLNCGSSVRENFKRLILGMAAIQFVTGNIYTMATIGVLAVSLTKSVCTLDYASAT